MLLQNDELKSLIHMGLTINQAKVYLALVQSGMSTARTISKVTGIARHDIYRVIFTLERLGFVDKILGIQLFSCGAAKDAKTFSYQLKFRSVFFTFSEENGVY